MQLALWGVAALGIVLTAVAFYAYWSRNVITLRTNELRRQVNIIAAGVAVSDIVPGSDRDVDLTRARLLKIEAGIIDARLAVVDGSGNVLFSTGTTPKLDRYPLDRIRPGTGDFDARTGVTSISGIGRVLLVAVPVAFAEPGQPNRYLLGARTLSDIGAADAWVIATIAGASVLSLLIAWLVGSLLSRRVTEPVRRLTKGARDIAEGGWGRQVAIEGDDETAELASAFNEMSARTAAAYRAQQALVSDVSHEIRTPVTSISGFANAIADGTLHEHGAIIRAAAIIASEASHLADITSSLLSLADLESGAVTLAREEVDIATLSEQLADRFALRASDAGVQLDLRMEGRGPLADPARLLQALSALVDNAVKYANGSVAVRGASAGAAWTVTVEDDGPGIPEGDRERVFDRFTRLDQSRSSAGSGLGLAICRRLVEAMGGEVTSGASERLGGRCSPSRCPRPPPILQVAQHELNMQPTRTQQSQPTLAHDGHDARTQLPPTRQGVSLMRGSRFFKGAMALALVLALVAPAAAFAVPGMGAKGPKAKSHNTKAAAKQTARMAEKQAKLAAKIDKVLSNRARAFNKAADKIESRITSATALAAEVGAAGGAVTDVNTALADAKTDLDAARVAETDAIALFKLVPTATDRRAAFAAAKAKAHEARSLLNQARRHLNDAIMKLEAVVNALPVPAAPVTPPAPEVPVVPAPAP
jgi:signal transduction histidine kinase